MYYDFDPLALSPGAVDELARDVARDFSLEAAEDVQRFQQRADRVFIETRVEALKRLRRIRKWWVLSAGLLSFAVWPLGWMSMVAGALAITVAYVVGFGEHHVHELLGYASTNAVQAKQDYFMLSRLQKMEAEVSERIEAIQSRLPPTGA